MPNAPAAPSKLEQRLRSDISGDVLFGNLSAFGDVTTDALDGVTSLGKNYFVNSPGKTTARGLELDLRPYFRDDRALKEVLVRNREFCEARLVRSRLQGRPAAR